MLDFINSIVDIFEYVIGALTNALSYIQSGIQTLLSTASVFPSIWSVVSGSYTSVILAMVAVGTGVALILALLRRV